MLGNDAYKTMKREYLEDFAKFFEQPTREGLRSVLQNHVGELNQLDFKEAWPEKSSLARHLIAFANSKGGCIIIGMKEEKETKSLEATGLSSFYDKAKIHDEVKTFISSHLKYEVHNFGPYAASEYPQILGKMFQVVIIRDEPRYIPFMAEADGTKIHKSRIYTRKGTESEEANYIELQEIINRRISTDYSNHNELSLEYELSELKILYSELKQFHTTYTMAIGDRLAQQVAENLKSIGLKAYQEENPYYPEESYDAFIARMIEIKKLKIQSMLLSSPLTNSDSSN